MRRRAVVAVVALLVTVVGAAGDPSSAGEEAQPVVALSVDGPSCARFANGHLKCWGANDYGELGLGDTRARGDDPGEMGEALVTVDLGRGRTATQVVTGGLFACALRDDGRVACWGNGLGGVLGQGNENHRGHLPGSMGDSLLLVPLGRPATAIAAGTGHVCAVLDDGRVKCWGSNGWGQLGLGDTDARGDQPGEMGTALPAVALGAGRIAVGITAGQAHSCALLDTGQVVCWGVNVDGQVGTGSPAQAIGDESGEMGDALQTVPLGGGRAALGVTAGSLHTCALLDTGQVKCWGINFNGELGLGDTAARGDQPGEMGDALPAVALGTGRSAVAVSAGTAHTCALLDTGEVKCWGFGERGSLGSGDVENLGDGPGEMGDALPVVDLGTGRSTSAVEAGAGRSCALLDDGAIKCWGDNESGALGLGDQEHRGDEAGEMGDSLPAVARGSGNPPARKVDIEIRRADRPGFVGNGVYNATGARQSITANVRRGATVTFVVRVRNESRVHDTLRVQGGPGAGRFTVRYSSGGVQTVRSYRLIDWPPNWTSTWTVRITAARNAVVGSRMPVAISVRSDRDPTKRDVVKAIARVVR